MLGKENSSGSGNEESDGRRAKVSLSEPQVSRAGTWRCGDAHSNSRGGR